MATNTQTPRLSVTTENVNTGFASQDEVAQFLRVSRRFVQEITGLCKDDLHYYKFGRCTRYKWKDVIRWAEERAAARKAVNMVAFQPLTVDHRV